MKEKEPTELTMNLAQYTETVLNPMAEEWAKENIWLLLPDLRDTKAWRKIGLKALLNILVRFESPSVSQQAEISRLRNWQRLLTKAANSGIGLDSPRLSKR